MVTQLLVFPSVIRGALSNNSIPIRGPGGLFYMLLLLCQLSRTLPSTRDVVLFFF
jgi:hypothetical protein